MNKNKAVIGAVLVVALLVGGWAIIRNKGAQKGGVATESPLKVVAVKDLGDVNFIMDFAFEKGFFKKNNVVVENVVLEKISDTRNVNTLLMSGEADAVMTGVSGELALYMNNAETRWLAETFTPFSFFGVSRFDRAHIGQVKKVGVIRFGGEPAMITEEILKQVGIDPTKVKMVAIPTNLVRKELLEKGDLDFIIVNSEQFVYDSGLDKRYTIFNPEDLFGGSQLYRGILTVNKVVQEKPDQLKKYVAAIYQTMDFMEKNPIDVKAYIKTKYGYTDEKADKFYKRFVVATQGESYIPQLASIDKMIESTKAQFKPTNPTRELNEFIYDSFAREAVSQDGR